MKHDIITPSDLHEKNIKRTDSIKFTCVKCGCECEITSFRKYRIPRYETMLCENCYREKQSLENWGTRKPQQSEKCKAITEAHNMEKYGKPYIYTYGSKEWCDNMETKYGVKYAQQSESIREITKSNNVKKYGVDHWAKSEDYKRKLPEIISKSKNTCMQKWGTDSYSKTNDFIEKKKQTSINKYGVPYYQQLPEARKYSSKLHTAHPEWGEKAAKSNRANHGGLHYTQTEKFKREQQERVKSHPEWIQRSLESNKRHYGGMLYSQTEEGRQSQRERIKNHPEWIQNSIDSRAKSIFMNCYFDSVPEFCVFYYCYYFGIPIVRNNQINFKYLDNTGKEHCTYPDFIINGRLVEIKGRQFYNRDGTWKFPYTKRKVNGIWIDLTCEEKEFMNDLYESKRQCLIKNNVIIFKDSDPWVQMCINCIKTMININSFIKSNPNNICYGYTPYNCDKTKEYQKPVGIGLMPFNIGVKYETD